MEKVLMPIEVPDGDARRRSGPGGMCASVVMKAFHAASVAIPIIVLVVVVYRMEQRLGLLEEEHAAMRAKPCRFVGLEPELVGRVVGDDEQLASSELERVDFERTGMIAHTVLSDAVDTESSEEDSDSFFDGIATNVVTVAAVDSGGEQPLSKHWPVTGGDDARVSNDEDGDDEWLMRSQQADDDVKIGWTDGDARALKAGMRRLKRQADQENSRNKAKGEMAPVVKPTAASRIKKQPPPKPAARSNEVAFHLNTRYTKGRKHLNGDSHYIWWDAPEWSRKSKLYTYNHNSGSITVKQRGVYYIYAQVQYGNENAHSIYKIMVGHSKEEPRELAKCWSSVEEILKNDSYRVRYPTCYTGIATALNHHNQSIWIEDIYGNQIGSDPISSYFGIFKLSDI